MILFYYGDAMKRNNGMLIMVIILTLISLMCLSFGVSYSFVTRSRLNKDTVVIDTGNLTSTVSYEPIKNLELMAMSDEEALQNNDYGIFTITKDNVYSVFYYITIGYTESSEKLLPLENVKVALYEVIDGFNISDKPVAGPAVVADLPVYEGTLPYDAMYTLTFGKFESGNHSKTYALKAWIADDTSDTYDNYDINIGVKVEQVTIRSKSFYNLNGEVYNESGNVIDNAKILLQKGTITKDIVDSKYSLENVPTGTWILDIIYNDSVYTTTLNIDSGEEVKLQEINNKNGNSGDYLQKVAYTYYTTPYQIIKFNNFEKSSNEIVNKDFNIPISYKLTGIDTLDTTNIDNLNFTLNYDKSIVVSMGE